MPRTILSILLATALASLAGTAEAATARNSQAGAFGSSKNACAATPYFPAGGCFSTYLADDGRDLFGQPPAAYRPGHRLTYPEGPLPGQGQ